MSTSPIGLETQPEKLAKMKSSDNLPSLGGLRAISILLVLIGHISGTKGVPKLDFHVGDYAHFGVVIFFVISGFLITTLLLAEHTRNGSVSLKLFYARRSIRIFPASYAYLGVVFVLSAMGIIHLRAPDFWHAATYTVNYLPNAGWEIGHLWSLSVEEQFYLLWPFAFVTLGPRRAIWVAIAVILLGPVARSAAWLFLRKTAYADLSLFPLVADSLAMGCLLARLRTWLEAQQWYLRLLKPGVSMLILVTVFAINSFTERTIVWIAGTSAINLGIAILIHRSVYYDKDWMGRLLNSKPLALIGTLSYSLYVWQQLFLNRTSDAWMTAFPQNIIFSVTAAVASYWLLEKPLFQLRHRLRADSGKTA